MTDDTPDPSEAVAAAKAGDDGKIGTQFSVLGIALNPCSIHHYEAYGRLTFDPISAREAAALLCYLLTKSGREASGLRSEKQIADFRFDAGEWAQKMGSPRADVVQEMIVAKDAVLANIEKAESVEPKPRTGLPSGND